MTLRKIIAVLLGVLVGWTTARVILGHATTPLAIFWDSQTTWGERYKEILPPEPLSDALDEETTFQRVAFPMTVAKVGYGVLSFDVAVQDGYVVGVVNVMLVVESTGEDGGKRGEMMNYVLNSKNGENVMLRQCWGVVN